MSRISIRRITIPAAGLVVCLGVIGCGGGGLHEEPQSEYVAPESPGEMKPPAKQSQRQQIGVPLD